MEFRIWSGGWALKYLWLLLFSCQSFARVSAEALYHIYDDGETRVQSPQLDVVWTTTGERLEIGAGAGQDLVSSASSDVRSYASKESIQDTRRETRAKMGWLFDEGKTGWSFVHSEESDYSSAAIGFMGTKDFYEKNTTFATRFSYGEDKISTAKNKEASRPMTHESYSLSVSQVLSRHSAAQLLLDYRIESGYLASPYRQARKKVSDGTVTTFPENMPLTRNRASLTGQINVFFESLNVSTSSSLRSYLDSWGVNSLTIEERLSKNFSDFFEFHVNARYYVQSKAVFYEDVYTELGPFYTGNKTLSNMSSWLVGLSPTIVFWKGKRLYLRYEYYLANYKDHSDLGKTAIVADDKGALSIRANILTLGFLGEF